MIPLLAAILLAQVAITPLGGGAGTSPNVKTIYEVDFTAQATLNLIPGTPSSTLINGASWFWFNIPIATKMQITNGVGLEITPNTSGNQVQGGVYLIPPGANGAPGAVVVPGFDPTKPYLVWARIVLTNWTATCVGTAYQAHLFTTTSSTASPFQDNAFAPRHCSGAPVVGGTVFERMETANGLGTVIESGSSRGSYDDFTVMFHSISPWFNRNYIGPPWSGTWPNQSQMIMQAPPTIASANFSTNEAGVRQSNPWRVAVVVSNSAAAGTATMTVTHFRIQQ